MPGRAPGNRAQICSRPSTGKLTVGMAVVGGGVVGLLVFGEGEVAGFHGVLLGGGEGGGEREGPARPGWLGGSLVARGGP